MKNKYHAEFLSLILENMERFFSLTKKYNETKTIHRNK